ncbi:MULTISPECIES: hypothetical protein [Microbulbifer]|uniref:hypothetical protein n=1 Tax=Microbulbifer TaxID=48073 RepID=UPI001E5BFEDF|nr:MULTISPECIES: hypothetical protein [Microbulbifer]UHQ55713.1 hypothetical protein LVE68_01610 [Microbulbifer sp. YPW16]
MAHSLLGQSRDPVCGATVPEGAHSWQHRHIKYSFCSEHCRSRFQRWPHLYVGEATFGLAEKQLGTAVFKAHRIRLTKKLNAEARDRVMASVQSLKGIDGLWIKGEEVLVRYDLMQVSLSDIEEAIIAETGKLRNHIPDRIERALIHYSEECELDNLSHLPSHYRP